MSYREADRELTNLLSSFGPHGKVVHTEAPFWRLQTDGVWEIQDAKRVTVGPGETHTRVHYSGRTLAAAFRMPFTRYCKTMKSLQNASLGR